MIIEDYQTSEQLGFAAKLKSQRMSRGGRLYGFA
jgi:hypothetical protein